MNYLYAASGALIAFFILQILQKKPKTSADYLLVALNVIIGLFLLADVLIRQGLTSFRIIFQNAIPLFMFPVFALYVLQFIRSRQGIKRAWYLIFVPGILFVIYSCLDHFVWREYDAAALVEHFNRPTLIYQFFFKGNQLLFIGILTWLLLQFRSFEEGLKQGYSFIDTVSLNWLRNFTIIYLASICLTFVLFLLQNVGLIPFEIQLIFGVVYGLLVLSVFYLNYHGIRHYTLAQEYQTPTAPVKEQSEAPTTTTHADLSESPPQGSTRDIEIHAKMIALFEEEEVYLTSKYGLRDLADDLGESSHTISRVINTLEQKNFYDFVNAYRVAHLQRLLDDPTQQQFTILALGLESGFNSKASINRIFKQTTGLTPREYMKKRSHPIAK